MGYAEQWEALSARIQGLARAGELYAHFQASGPKDDRGVAKDLRARCESTIAALEGFRTNFATVLPVDALASLDSFLNGSPARVIKDQTSSQRGATAGLVFLSALESELSYLLSSRQEQIRARSERAFLHLQRLLVVDKALRQTWIDGFVSGEVRCEQLGSVHLLWHGIYAFKVDALGARTDLVFNEPIKDTLIGRGIEGLVLTEWKVAEPSNASARFRDARIQADRYKRGALAGSELTDYRYLVAVSRKELPSVPSDVSSNGIIYRHLNMVVDPSVPSARARLASE